MAHLVHDRYDVGDKLGEGGMGVVYRATDTRLGRPVALKVVHERLADSASARARLIREAQVAASLNHPNICTIYEVFELDRDEAGREDAARIGDGPVIVLELVEGETLHARLARTGRLPLRELVDVGVQIADGLAEAHQQQIIHRDLKPQNVFLTRSGRVKILDFGLARAVPQAAGPEAATVRLDTATGDAAGGGVKGTVPYMSPEQATGRMLDSRSDVFSFGIMLYEMAGGRRPFRGDTSVEVLARILEAEPPSLGDLRPELPAALERIVQRCLRKAPDDRYHDTRDLLTDLREVQDTLRTSSERRPPFQPLQRPRRETESD
ncbi:MAG TPA: serine/threonine-protein kinase [Vicinamibacterales bacterium]|nr:serine/threonine-protein kinase [Vicinamibacterales bacterium]